MTTPTGAALRAHVDRLRGLPNAADLPLDRWWEYLELVLARRQVDPDGPILTALIGPTGAGKSTLLNLVLGQNVSRAGAIRPTTSRPLAVAGPAGRRVLEADPFIEAGRLDLEVIELETPPRVPWLDRYVVIDTPDFDSVEDLHRQRSWRLLLRADRVVLVVNPEKYGDAAVEDTVRELARLGNVAACVFNKADSQAPYEDCKKRLIDAGLPPPISVPRLSDPEQGSDLDPELHERLLEQLIPREIPPGWLQRRLNGAERLERELRDRTVTPWVVGASSVVDSARAALDSWIGELPTRVRSRLPLELDEAVRRELLDRFRQQVRRFDPLREPRRWFRETVGRWVGLSSDPDSKGDAQTTAQFLTEAYRDRHLDLHYALREELVAALNSCGQGIEPGFELPLPDAIASDRVTPLLEQAFERLCDEISRECDRIAEGLGLGSKITFFGSQAAVHSMMLLLFVKTGGLTPTELIAQGLLSPALAGIAEKLVSSGEVAAVEERLGKAFTDDMTDRITETVRPLSEALEAMREQIPTPDEWHEALRAWQEGT